MDKSKRIVCGINSVFELVKVNPSTIDSVCLVKSYTKSKRLRQIKSVLDKKRISARLVEPSFLLKYYTHSQGCLAFCNYPKIKIKNKKRSILLLVDSLKDPRNLGAIIRTSWLIGVVDGIILASKGSIDPGLASVQKAASGGAEHLSIIRTGNLVKTLTKFKDNGYHVAMLNSKGKDNLAKSSLPDKLLVAVGGEEKGISKNLAKLCSSSYYIKQSDSASSYNVSVAVSIILWEFSKS